MVSNVSNYLKEKIINGEKISYKDAKKFMEYIISKTKLIVDRMYNKNYNCMYLFKEIAFSYGLDVDPTSTYNDYVVLDICGYYYLVDMNFNNNRYRDLSKNKYVDYTKSNFVKYLSLCGGSDE